MPKDIEDIALQNWDHQSVAVHDKYGYIAFDLIGLIGIAISVLVTWFHDWELLTVYVVIFFISLLFLIGGIRWGLWKKPSRKELKELYAAEKDIPYMDHTPYRELAERRRAQKNQVNVGRWEGDGPRIGP